MKDKLIALMLMCVASSPAFAEEFVCDAECPPVFCESTSAFYAGAFGGANFHSSVTAYAYEVGAIEVRWNPGYIVGGFVGYKFNDSVRAEIEVSNRHNTLKDLRVINHVFGVSGYYNNISYLTNVIVDFNSVPYVTPYFGAGIGCATNKVKFSDENEWASATADHFAGQMIVGVSYPVACNFTLAAEYRWLYQNKDLNDQSGVLNLKYFFN